MIKKEDLRIGNNILVDGNMETVLELRSGTVVYGKYWGTSPVKDGYDWHENVEAVEVLQENSYENIEPVPLTHEILDKTDLEITEDSINNYRVFKFPRQNAMIVCFDVSQDAFVIFTPDYSGKYLAIAVAKYLHKLQNLHYDLTGSNLAFNSTGTLLSGTQKA